MLEELSDTFYPGAYCNCVEKTQKACYEENILELWADQASPVTSYEEDFGFVLDRRLFAFFYEKFRFLAGAF